MWCGVVDGPARAVCRFVYLNSDMDALTLTTYLKIQNSRAKPGIYYTSTVKWMSNSYSLEWMKAYFARLYPQKQPALSKKSFGLDSMQQELIARELMWLQFIG